MDFTDIQMNQIPKVGWISLDDRFWLQVTVDGKIKETSTVSRGSLCWKDKFTLYVCPRVPNVSPNIVSSNVRKSSELSFRLYARRYVHENKLIGAVGKCVNTLVTLPDDSAPFHLFMSSQSSVSSSGLQGVV